MLQIYLQPCFVCSMYVSFACAAVHRATLASCVCKMYCLLISAYCLLMRPVVQVPPEYGNVLEVSYALPGYLATGVSANITVTFTPKVTCTEN